MESLTKMWETVRARHQGDRGASLVEYALLLALIAVVCVVAITYIGKTSSDKYSSYNACVEWAGTQANVPPECR